MPKIMLINVTHSEESRVGIIHDRVLDAFEIESLSREHLKGNIYKGIVHRIHPALEAAFVDIGAERDAFLPLDEICFRNLRPSENGQPSAGENGRRRRRIRDILRPGEEILVQITKEQFANKPPTLTTFYSLPGRYLVLLPGSDDTGVSRRIEGEDRTRLRKLVEDLNPPEGFGLIVRTAAGADEDSGELARDFLYLQRLWQNVQQVAATKQAPALVYREHDIVLRTIRDFLTPDIDEIHIDNEEVYQRARSFLGDLMPGKEHLLRLYHGEQPIFSAFDVESQIESIFKRRVQLKSGASIVIDGTEALTAIDVNSGGSVRGQNPEETAFRTNLEAANQIARQLRLRDIGGLIVIDFIDMRDGEHIHEVERTLREAMRLDRARHEAGRISRFGLMEISRQRLRPAAMTTTYTACPMCEGHGAVRTTESAALVALRKIHNRIVIGDIESLRVTLPKHVALYLLNQKRDDLAKLEERYSCAIAVELSDQLMPHEVEIETRERSVAKKPAPVKPGAVAAVDAPAVATTAEAAATNGAEKKKRRRRGRRRGSGRRAAVAIGEALASLGKLVGYSPTEPVPPPPVASGKAEESVAQGAEPAASSGQAEATRRSGTGRRRRRRRSGAARQPVAAPVTGTMPEASRAADSNTPALHPVEAAPAADSTAVEPRPAELQLGSPDPAAVEAAVGGDPAKPAKPKRSRRSASRRAGGSRRQTASTTEEGEGAAKAEAMQESGDGAKEAKPGKPRRRSQAKTKAAASSAGESAAKKSRRRSSRTRKRKPAAGEPAAVDA
jgi:ribonuclease E